MFADVLEILIRANLVAAAAVLAVLALRRPVRRLFGARAGYTLWLAVPLSALASIAPRPAAVATALEPISLAAAAAVGASAPAALPGLAASMLTAAWLAGVLLTGLILARSQARFVAALGRLEPLGDGVLRAEHPTVGPAVVGAFRPRIVTPADFEIRFEPEEQALILSHEGVHLARGDGLVNGLAAAAQCVCWFNPLIHLAARALRVDQELACDAAVLARRPQQRRTYARALLKAQLGGPALPVGCHWQHPLKERIAMLKAPLPARSRRIAGLAAVAVATLTAAGAAWAVQPPPAPTRLVLSPVWVSKPDGKDIASVYPAAALAQGVKGQALVTCRVTGDGRLAGCKVLREAPAGMGFGAAFLQNTDRFRMAARDRNGQRTAGQRVNIPVRFMIPQ